MNNKEVYPISFELNFHENYLEMVNENYTFETSDLERFMANIKDLPKVFYARLAIHYSDESVREDFFFTKKELFRGLRTLLEK